MSQPEQPVQTEEQIKTEEVPAEEKEEKKCQNGDCNVPPQCGSWGCGHCHHNCGWKVMMREMAEAQAAREDEYSEEEDSSSSSSSSDSDDGVSGETVEVPAEEYRQFKRWQARRMMKMEWMRQCGMGPCGGHRYHCPWGLPPCERPPCGGRKRCHMPPPCGERPLCGPPPPCSEQPPFTGPPPFGPCGRKHHHHHHHDFPPCFPPMMEDRHASHPQCVAVVAGAVRPHRHRPHQSGAGDSHRTIHTAAVHGGAHHHHRRRITDHGALTAGD